MTPEWSRPERLDTIGERPRDVAIEAGEDERRALAARFGLRSIERLAATFSIHRDAAGVTATGRVTAAVVQLCSATGVPLPAQVDEAVTLLFRDDDAGGEDEVELDEGALDVLPIDNGAIDLGEAAAETMALALDPFPRAPDAEAALREAGVLREDEVGPFAGLAALKRQLED